MRSRLAPLAFCSLLFSLLLVQRPPAALADVGEPHPDAPPELEALAFLVGEWELTTSFAQADGTRRETKARLVGRWAMDGLAIVVEETHPYPQGPGGIFAGLTTYTVHPESRQIVGSSNNTLGNRKQLAVTVDEGEVRMVQSGELFDGREGYNQHTYHSIGPDRYAMRLDACVKEGEPCIEGSYSYVATRTGHPPLSADASSAATRQPSAQLALARRYLDHYAAGELASEGAASD